MNFPVSTSEQTPEAAAPGLGIASEKRLNGTHGRKPKAPNGEKAKIIIEPANADLLRELAGITRLTLTQITNTILSEALKRIELVPTTLYDFKIK